MNRNRIVLALALGLSTLIAAAPSAEARRVVRVRPHARVVVKTAPPKPKVVVTRPKSPSTRHVWVEGYWSWDTKANRHVWIDGEWALPPSGLSVWVPGHWKKADDGWEWKEGHWSK